MADFIKIENLEKLLKKMDAEHLLGKAVYNCLFRMAETTLNKAKTRSPHRTGRTWSSLGKEEGKQFDRAPIPKWVMVGTNVNANGFPYPKALDDGYRTDTGSAYHYRGHSLNAELYGQETKGWFTDTPGLLANEYKRIGDMMLDEIAKEWGK